MAAWRHSSDLGPTCMTYKVCKVEVHSDLGPNTYMKVYLRSSVALQGGAGLFRQCLRHARSPVAKMVKEPPLKDMLLTDESEFEHEGLLRPLSDSKDPHGV